MSNTPTMPLKEMNYKLLPGGPFAPDTVERTIRLSSDHTVADADKWVVKVADQLRLDGCTTFSLCIGWWPVEEERAAEWCIWPETTAAGDDKWSEKIRSKMLELLDISLRDTADGFFKEPPLFWGSILVLEKMTHITMIENVPYLIMLRGKKMTEEQLRLTIKYSELQQERTGVFDNTLNNPLIGQLLERHRANQGSCEAVKAKIIAPGKTAGEPAQ